MSGSLVEQLASRIEDLIAEKALPRGARLPERALEERLRVSRSPVREALRRLALTSVVDVRAEGGYAVPQRSVKTPRQQFDTTPADATEPIYLRIAEDRLATACAG